MDNVVEMGVICSAVFASRTMNEKWCNVLSIVWMLFALAALASSR